MGEAIAAAHAAGIVHRDVKPENVMVRRDGYVKLVDFGLAKSLPRAESAAGAETNLTAGGMVMGTMPYMSPEQALGRPLDARTDIFSFALVLYEMLAGRHPFAGESDLEVWHAIVSRPVPPLPADVQGDVRRTVERALQKDPDARMQSMAEVVAALRLVRANSASLPARITVPLSKGAIRSFGVAAVVAIASALFVRRAPVSSEVPPPDSRDYVQLTNFADSATQPALSPDGRMLAFVRGPSTFIGAGQVYVRLLPSGDPVELTHDDVLKMAPRFSPDGARIAYTTLSDSAGWETWTVSVLGREPPRRWLANAEGLNWIRERETGGGSRPRVLFSEQTGNGVTMGIVTATESRADQRTIFVQDGVMEHFSYLSPDGKQLLLAEMGFNGWQPCRLIPFDGRSRGRKVGPPSAQCTSAAWSPDGTWMYFSADPGNGFHIWRQRFPDGAPQQITFGATADEGIDFDRDGRSFVTSIGNRQSTLWVHDANGDRQVTSDAYTFLPSFSRDGRKLYYLVRVPGPLDGVVRGTLWMTDLQSNERQRFLPDYLIEHYSLSGDGERVVFVVSGDASRAGVWIAPLDGRSTPRRLSAAHGLTAFFGHDAVFFAAQDRDRTVIYRVKEDGTDLREVPAAPPPYFLYGVSPDERFLALWVNGVTEESTNSVMLYPVNGGEPIVVCPNHCAGRDAEYPQFLTWAPDGRYVYLHIWAQATYAIPLGRGEVLPALPRGGIRSAAEIAALPGARPFAVPGAFPGPDLSVYAYAKSTAQRNIYRVPVR
jgi:eukaryotic-like serine/threonine-protein kinase